MAWEIAVVLGMVGVPALLLFMVSVLNKQHMPIKLLLLLVTFVLVDVLLAVIVNIAEANNTPIFNILNGVFTGYNYVLSLVIFWFVLQFIFSVVKLKNKSSVKV